MKNLFVLFLLTSGFCTSAFAWKETGGGDEVGLEFHRAFASALRAVKEQKFRGNFSAEDLERASQKAQVIVVSEPLKIHFRDLVQDSVAANEPATGVIKINRDRWLRLKDPRIQEAVALHEVLSLMGIERTGVYEYSARYLEQAGLSPWLVSGLDESRVERPSAKTLTCEISYLPPGGKYGDEENIRFSESLKEFGPREPWSLQSNHKVKSKDGRYEFYLWGVQPFRTAFNPAAYEYTGISISDLRNKTGMTAGPNMPLYALRNENYARLSVVFNVDSADIAVINANCSLL